MVTDPFVVLPSPTIENVSVEESLSVATAVPLTEPPSATVFDPSLATGLSLTSVTLILTVTVFELVSSFALYVKLSKPLKLAIGV